MSTHQDNDRRAFLKRGAALTTASAAGVFVSQPTAKVQAAGANSARADRLPREVWIATIAQEGLRASTPKQMIDRMLGRMHEAAKMEPDVICLPEVFPFSNLDKSPPPVIEVAEEGIGPVLQPFAKFAVDHNCYLVCPVYTKHKGNCYNAAVFLDRKGAILGEYHKTYATVDEIELGVAPGSKTPSVFVTDFGKVGSQICFDIEWDSGWRELKNAGAEIVFWPSAFAGGQMINARAWQNRYCVVSSTNKDVSKICDITGEEVATTNRWHSWVCAPVNLEKAFLHTWPYVRRFGDIVSKYGQRVRITTYAAEEWSIIESRDPTIKIADIMNEFELVSIDNHLGKAERIQNQRRPD